MSNQRVLPVKVAIWSELVDQRPVAARVADVDLLVLRIDDTPRVLKVAVPIGLVDWSAVGWKVIC